MQIDRAPVRNYTHMQTHSLEGKAMAWATQKLDLGGLNFVCDAVTLSLSLTS